MLSKLRGLTPKGWPQLPLVSSVRGSIIIGSIICSLILAAVVAFPAWRALQHRSDVAHLEHHSVIADQLQDAKAAGMVAALMVQQYAISGDINLPPVIQEQLDTTVELIQTARTRAEEENDPALMTALDQITAETSRLSDLWQAILAARASNDVEGALRIIEGATPSLQQLTLQVDAAIALERGRVSTLRQRADETADVMIQSLFIAGALGALIGLATAVTLARSVLKPLQSLEATADAVAQGDLEARAQITGPRELARLGEALNSMADTLLDASKRRELEAALRESEERFRLLAENAQDAIWRYRLYPTPGFDYMSPASSAQCGYSPEEFYANPNLIYQTVHPEDRQKLIRWIGGHGPLRRPAVIRWIRKDGTMIWTEQRMVPVYDESGRLVAIEGISRDITERKRIEEALRESEERLRAAITGAPVVLFVLDREGMFTLCEGRALEKLGLQQSDLIGRSVFEVCRGIPAIVESVQHALRGESICSIAEVRDLVLEIHYNPTQDEEGEVTGVIGVATDITERRRMEEALRESEERWRALFQSAPDAIVTVDSEGRIVLVNDRVEEVFGYSKDELLGQPVEILIPERLRGVHISHRAEYYSRPRTRPMGTGLACVGRRKDGSEFPTEIALNYIKTRDGVLVMAVIRDITERKRMEEALRESEEKMRAVLENAPDFITCVQRDGRILFVNRTVSGVRMEQVKGRNVYDLIPAEHRQQVRKAIERALKTGKAQTYEVAWAGPHGNIRWWANRVGPLRRNGEIAGAIIISTDITERRRIEEALRESEERLQAVISTAPVILFALDREGTITFSEGAGLSLLGLRPGETVGQSIFERYKHAPEICQAVRRALSGEPVTITFDAPNDITFQSCFSPIQDEEGQIVGVIGVATDITERKRMEEALRESEERWRSLVENAPDFITTLDRQGRILFVNRTMAGISGEQVIGSPLCEWIPPEYHQVVREAIAHAFQKGEPAEYENAWIGPNGDRYWYANRVGPVKQNGRVTYVILISRDITERKRWEEEQHRLNQELAAQRKTVEELNRSLEEKVRQRTKELRRSLEELRKRTRQLLDARAMAARDPLTGLRNHRTFQERVRQEVSKAEKSGGTVCLIMLDIDGFKGINDSVGHLAGDQILRDLASTLVEIVGEENAYRYGGDEFAVLLPGATLSKATRLAERLRRALERRRNGFRSNLSVSLGVAAFPDGAHSAEELIYGADAAMYWAKSAGKNRVGSWSALVKHRVDGSLPWHYAERGVKAPDAVAALAAALAAKDPTTSEHTKRCSWYAMRLAEELGLEEKERSVVQLAALLHDIGKLAVPEDVLFKPGPLNPEEWAQMKEHPKAALHILGYMRAISDATPAILHYHEHFDGSGYPDGLAGDQIPMAARILLVVDAFDAMTTDRPYRKAMPVEAAIAELRRHAGTQFDPEAVEAFIRVLEKYGPQPLHNMADTRKQKSAPSPRRRPAPASAHRGRSEGN